MLEHSGCVYVADRKNDRLQVFLSDGSLVAVWNGFMWPSKIVLGPGNVLCVVELRGRVNGVDLEGNVLWRWGDDGVAG
jgi:hypothetical protein